MTPDIANSTFVDAPHFETFFHTGKQSLYPFASLEAGFRPRRVNQFEAVAELGIAPINLRERLPFHTENPANLPYGYSKTFSFIDRSIHEASMRLSAPVF